VLPEAKLDAPSRHHNILITENQTPNHLRSRKKTLRIGIDVGGTFTDLVVAQNDQPIGHFKTHSTPADPSIGVLRGLTEVAEAHGQTLDQLLAEVELIVHGTTVATNTLIERKGANVGLITTEGFRDLLEMREGLKEDRYNLRMTPVEPLIPRYLRLGVPERVKYDGSVHTPLDVDALRQALHELKDEGVDSLAVCFLFSFMNPDHELQAEAEIRMVFPDAFVSLSHQVLPQIKEFDRLSTTALNAYVGPELGRYLGNLQQRMAEHGEESKVLIIQSNGGASPIEDSIKFAVRSILSGPAGGAKGAAYAASVVGEENVIALDMGGTSTDISIIEGGRPHVANEKYEAGWKIAVPMIDIHTLGAGGGSIARVDLGGVLRVGPDSAGAEPGPACYGLGGEDPTVTDAALVLGLLDATSFLGGRVSLDSSLSEQAIREKVAEPLSLSVTEAAAGILRVVSNSIAEGIRLASVSKGLDPREFSMVAFGGAAGMLANQIAREVGIQKVLIPPAAPVLSAFGMLASDLQYDFSQSYPAGLTELDLDEMRSRLRSMEDQGRKQLHDNGMSDKDIAVEFTADMRYLDQIYEVTVPVPDLDLDESQLRQDWADNFHRRFEELYSYSQSEQEIRLVTLRASISAPLPRIIDREEEQTSADGSTQSVTRQVHMGDWEDVAVFDADSIPNGAQVQGPAILESEFTTVVLGHGDVVVKGAGDTLVMELTDVESVDPQTVGADPVTLSVVENRLESIAIEMMDVMLRTAMSQILNSSRDFSTAILDKRCRLIAQGEGIPVHVSALPIAGEAVLNTFGDDIHPGDMFALNDPYNGGSHLPDITVIKPVFYEGKLLFLTVNRAHHSDVGGASHGGYNPSASEIYHEGLRIPPLRIHDKGKPIQDLLAMLASNVRLPENFLGDLNAQIGSVSTAERRMLELLDHYAVEPLLTVIDGILSATEVQVRQFISDWPDGVYKGESFIDDDGFDSKMIPIRAEITVKGDTMKIDLSESSPQVTGFINSAYANTRSIAHAAIMYLAPYNVAKNEGSMGPLTVVAPKGLIVNANPPAPVCMSTNHCAEEIIEAVFKALANAVPLAVNAGFSRRLRYAITGTDPRTGRYFIWHFFMARGGGGASSGNDGWTGVGEVNVAGGIRSPSVEVTEERFPLFVVNHELRPDSAGDGEWRGGLGAVCEIIYEGEGKAAMNVAGDGVIVPPFGLFGGSPGLPHRYSLVSNGTERVLKSKETGVPVFPGDRIIALSSGGGGYGDPKERDQKSKAWDQKNGYLAK
jgi:N-methylhydantoinase A/oxoprolinase/acetone carboxylase beta subunit/N-methylhydantoinase B/oxoprolinase/acetone carboxylase alpha subunit